MNGKHLAALYVELVSMYEEEFPAHSKRLPLTPICEDMIERMEDDLLSKEDILTIEPIFVYGHIDIHSHVKAKKRFIWV